MGKLVRIGKIILAVIIALIIIYVGLHTIAVRQKVSLAVIFCGVAWCFGTHDRPWRERAIFGKIRYMSADGLRRKFDAERYVKNEKRDQVLG